MFNASIVIPSHRPHLITRTCESIQSLIGIDKCEVIIITDYDTQAFQEKYNTFTWININEKSIPAKRNRGIKECSSEIIGFLDDDCLPESTWLTEGLAYLTNNRDICGVEGLTTIENTELKSAHLKRFKRLEKKGYRTNNIFYRKEALEKVNFFDERFSFQREDTDLAFSLLDNNFKISFSDKIKVIHLFRKSEKWDLLKNLYNRRYDPLLHKKHKKRYRDHIKTPVTRSTIFVMSIYLLLLIAINTNYLNRIHVFSTLTLLLCLGYFKSFGIVSLKEPVKFLINLMSFLISPIVLWGALIFGCLKFRNLLLF